MARVTLWPYAHALSHRVANARTAWSARHGLVLEIDDGAGHVGQGEAAPLPGYSGDSLEACAAALGVVAARGLVPLSVDLDVGRSLDAALRARLDDGAGPSLPPAARFAVETALLDLHARQLGLPLSTLLREELGRVHGAKPEHEIRRELLLSALLDAADTDEMLAQAERALGRGIETTKWKIGRPGDGEHGREVRAVERLRRLGGEGLGVRLDANGALPFEEAPELLEAFAVFAPALVEEPCAGRLAELAARTGTRVPLGADESLQIDGALDALGPALAAGAVRAVVLKPTTLGGLYACTRLAAAATALGASVVLSHCFEGPIALAAASALALALPFRELPAGLDRHAGLDAFEDVPLPFLAPDRLVFTQDPGLGIRRLLPR